MPGVIEVSQSVPIGSAIDAIALIVECSLPGELDGSVRYLSDLLDTG